MGSVNNRRLNTIFASAPFDPRSIPGLKLWLAADRISGLNDGDPVGTWSDLSGQSNHATQATGSKKPLYKVGIQNGKPGVLTDGVDDVLVSAFSQADPQTLFAVVKRVTVVTNKNYFGGGASTTRDQIYASATGKVTMWATKVGPEFTDPGTSSAFLMTAVFNGTSSRVRLNNGSAVTGDPGTNNANGGLSIGGNFSGAFSSFYSLEILEYSGALTVAQEGQLQNYLNRWALW